MFSEKQFSNFSTSSSDRISLSYTDDKYKKFRPIAKYAFDILYNKNKYGFMKNIKVKNNNNVELIEDKNGEISLYGVNFARKSETF